MTKQKKLISQIEASRIIGVSRSAICLGIKEGRIKAHIRQGKKLVDINQVKQLYKVTIKRSGRKSPSKYLQDDVNGGKKKDLFDIHDIRLQAEKNKALREQIQLEAALGKYLEYEKVKKEFCNIAESLKKSLLAIPDRVAPIIAGELGVEQNHEVRQILIREIKLSLQGMVDKKLKEYEKEKVSDNSN